MWFNACNSSDTETPKQKRQNSFGRLGTFFSMFSLDIHKSSAFGCTGSPTFSHVRCCTKGRYCGYASLYAHCRIATGTHTAQCRISIVCTGDRSSPRRPYCAAAQVKLKAIVSSQNFPYMSASGDYTANTVSICEHAVRDAVFTVHVMWSKKY